MRNSTALKKNLPIHFHYWKAFVGTAEQLSMKIDDIEICIFGPKCIRTIESIFNHNFTDDEQVDLIANTFQVKDRELYINETYITEFDFSRMWLINEAFAKVTHYSIRVNHDTLKWTYSWSLDWHVQNLGSEAEYIDNIKPEDLKQTLSDIKERYSKLVEHNSYYDIEVIEYRGKEYNRLYDRDSVGCEPDNFDEKIRNVVFKNR